LEVALFSSSPNAVVPAPNTPIIFDQDTFTNTTQIHNNQATGVITVPANSTWKADLSLIFYGVSGANPVSIGFDLALQQTGTGGARYLLPAGITSEVALWPVATLPSPAAAPESAPVTIERFFTTDSTGPFSFYFFFSNIGPPAPLLPPLFSWSLVLTQLA